MKTIAMLAFQERDCGDLKYVIKLSKIVTLECQILRKYQCLSTPALEASLHYEKNNISSSYHLDIAIVHIDLCP